MKLLKSALLGTCMGTMAVWPVAAQWQVPLNSVPVGTGAGTGFNSAGPGTNGQFFVGVTGGLPSWVTMSQDCTTSNAGVMTCLKSNNVAFGQWATAAISPIRAGDIGYWNGSIWTTLGGNNSGTGVFTENASGVPGWTALSNATTPHSSPGGRLVLQMSAGIGGGIPTVDVVAAASKVVIIPAGTTTWTVPLDFTSTNAIEAFGAGGGGGGALAAGSTGGGGGGYSKATNQTLTPGAPVTVAVAAGGTAGAASGGSGGSAGDTYLCNTLVTNCASIAGTAVKVGSHGGAGGVPPGGSSAAGGSTTGAVGSTTFAGGGSGIGGGTSSGGAGGSAGPSGAGGTGANGSGSTGGAGGTANNGTVAGGAANSAGVQSGTIETETLTGTAVKVGSGAGGSSSGGTAGACASYGGGGGGGANLNGAGQAGCPGALVVTYTPAPTTLNYTPCAGYIQNCAGPYIPIYNGTSTTLLQFTSSVADVTGPALTLTAADNTSGNCYDIYAANNSGIFLGTGPAWSSCTAGSSSRGTGAGTTQLAAANGFLVNAVAITIKNNSTSFSCAANQCTAIGTVHMALNGQVSYQFKAPAMSGGPNAEIGLYNFYNRYQMRMRGQDSTASWTYNLVTARSANASNSNRLTVLDGLGVEQMRFFYNASVTGPAAWAGTPELTLNQACATGISGGAGQGALVSQPAGNSNGDGGVGPTWYTANNLLGETFMQACDGQVNASITIFGLDFGQYMIEYSN